MTPLKKVLIVGAGPSGLLLALLLAQKGINVLVFDSAEGLDEQPRATHYAGPAVHELHRAGVLEDIQSEGFIARTVCWRKLDGELIAGLDSTPLNGTLDQITCLPLNKVAKILKRHLDQQLTAKVLWSHKVVEIGQSADKAWIDAETPEGTQRFEADYICGCDGANSIIRRKLFGDFEFPGKTWDEQIVATNTYYDFEKYGWNQDSSFVIHPEHFFMAAKISKDGLWRVTYGEKPGLSREELLARQPDKFRAFLPGHPEPDQYKIVNISPYKVHQRLAEKMRVGRFLLAADAAHLCNPFGGLGLTGGIVDVGGLADCLIGMHEDKADETILDMYNDVRRKIYQTVVDPISSQNLRRMFEQNPDTALQDDDFLKMCKRAETDVDFCKIMARGANVLRYDFTQHYIVSH